MIMTFLSKFPLPFSHQLPSYAMTGNPKTHVGKGFLHYIKIELLSQLILYVLSWSMIFKIKGCI